MNKLKAAYSRYLTLKTLAHNLENLVHMCEPDHEFDYVDALARVEYLKQLERENLTKNYIIDGGRNEIKY